MTGAQAHPEFTPPDASVIEAEVAAALAEVDMAEVMAATAHAMAQAHAELQAARLQGDVAVD